MSISDHKHMPEPVRRIEVFTGAGRRRNWLPEEKAAIIAESYAEGERVCSVARRHGLTPQQLFTWRRQARGTRTAETPAFVPGRGGVGAGDDKAPSSSVVACDPRRAARRRERPHSTHQCRAAPA